MRKFTLLLNAAKITDYNKQGLKKNVFTIKFSKKKSVSAYVYLPQEWS